MKKLRNSSFSVFFFKKKQRLYNVAFMAVSTKNPAATPPSHISFTLKTLKKIDVKVSKWFFFFFLPRFDGRFFSSFWSKVSIRRLDYGLGMLLGFYRVSVRLPGFT